MIFLSQSTKPPEITASLIQEGNCIAIEDTNLLNSKGGTGNSDSGREEMAKLEQNCKMHTISQGIRPAAVQPVELSRKDDIITRRSFFDKIRILCCIR